MGSHPRRYEVSPTVLFEFRLLTKVYQFAIRQNQSCRCRADSFPGDKTPDDQLTTHPHFIAEVRISVAVIPPHPYALLAWTVLTCTLLSKR